MIALKKQNVGDCDHVKVRKKTHAEAKDLLAKIQGILRAEKLSPEERSQLELQAAALSGSLLSTWFPVPWANRLVMALVFLLGAWQAAIGNTAFLLVWLFLPLFSPRIMGEVWFALGRISRTWTRS